MKLVELYTDIYTKLAGNEELVNLLHGENKIYDFLPGVETPGPYIVIGDATETEGELLSKQDRLVKIRLYIWSSYRGRSECIAIARKIEEILENKEYFFESLDVNRDGEGWTQGIITFRISIERGI